MTQLLILHSSVAGLLNRKAGLQIVRTLLELDDLKCMLLDCLDQISQDTTVVIRAHRKHAEFRLN